MTTLTDGLCSSGKISSRPNGNQMSEGLWTEIINFIQAAQLAHLCLHTDDTEGQRRWSGEEDTLRCPFLLWSEFPGFSFFILSPPELMKIFWLFTMSVWIIMTPDTKVYHFILFNQFMFCIYLFFLFIHSSLIRCFLKIKDYYNDSKTQ